MKFSFSFLVKDDGKKIIEKMCRNGKEILALISFVRPDTTNKGKIKFCFLKNFQSGNWSIEYELSINIPNKEENKIKNKKHFSISEEQKNMEIPTDLTLDEIKEATNFGGVSIKFNFALFKTFSGKQQVSVLAKEYTGLINIQHSCYMNTVIQTCFHIPAIRNIIYSIQCNDDNYVDSLIFNLQNIFYCLENSSSPVDPILLLKAAKEEFGLLDNEQQDISEFAIRLFEKIEEEDKTGRFAKLTKGIINKQCIKNGVVEDEMQEIFNFFPISLNKENLDDAFEDIFSPHTDKSNEISVAKNFEELPPILFILFCRFDFCSNRIIKLNDFMGYNEELNISKYIENKEDGLYTLFGVLVHNGHAQQGHYYCYLNTEKGWHKLEDSKDKTIHPERAFKWCFGNGEIDDGESAYVLVYIRNKDKNDIMQNVSIPDHVKEYSKKFEEKRKMVREEASKYNINILYQSNAEEREAPVLMGFNFELTKEEKKKQLINESIKVKPGTTKKELYEMIEAKCKYPIRIWEFKYCSSLELFNKDDSIISSREHQILVQKINEGEKIEVNSNDERVIYVKYYDYRTNKLYFIKSYVVNLNETVSSICTRFSSDKGLESSDDLLVFLEYDKKAKLIKQSCTFRQVSISNSSIFIIQKNPELDSEFKTKSKKKEETKDEPPTRNVIRRTRSIFALLPDIDNGLVTTYLDEESNYKFYKYHFGNSEVPENDDILCSFDSSEGVPLISIKKGVAQEGMLEYDPTKQCMILFRKLSWPDPLEVKDYGNREENCYKNNKYSVYIYDGVPEEELKDMYYYSVQYSNDGLHSEYEGPYLAPKYQSPEEIIEGLKKRGVKVEDGKYRAFEINSHSMYNCIPLNKEYKRKFCDIRIERIPESQNCENDELISVSFYHESKRNVGFPFWYKPKDNDVEQIKSDLTEFIYENFPKIAKHSIKSIEIKDIKNRKNAKVLIQGN